MKILKAIISNVYIKNFFLAALIFTVLILCTLWWLRSYTHHGEAVIVPDIKGLQVAEAIPFLERAQLRYEVVDSIHVKNAKPGSIVEVSPPVGSKVKTNRIIFITMNSFSVETLVAPEVKDLSQRQAIAMLKAAGFENIQIRTVSSPYKDLVINLKYNGREVKPGEKIPVIGDLVLEVSAGEGDSIDSETPIESEANPEESFF